MLRYLCENETCVDFDGHGAKRGGRTSRNLFCANRISLCRHRSGCFIVVSEPLRRHGWLSHGQLQPADTRGAEPPARNHLRRTTHAAEPPSRAGALERNRVEAEQLVGNELRFLRSAADFGIPFSAPFFVSVGATFSDDIQGGREN